jgi:hypothetical protein
MADRSKKRDYGEKTRINPFSPRPSFQLVRRSANNRAYRRPGSRPPPSVGFLLSVIASLHGANITVGAGGGGMIIGPTQDAS